ncbi:hypothetical protein [Streptomyces sp. PU-14G]|uniref:hypothetical protein n=1 Tax=Streptomyces sp. PU-14G TaxID=2800808 RepID=UPI0034DFC7A2
MTLTPVLVPGDQPQESDPALTCFVIGPIGDRHAPPGSQALAAYEDSLEIFEKVVLLACSAFGVVPVRADRMSEMGDITEQICRNVLLADVVIADVSGGNANVMYELGMRHVSGKPTIHIGEYGQLPFDISPIRTIHFVRSASGLIDARKELESALEGTLRNGSEPLAPARILFGLQPAESGDAEDDSTPGLIDRFARVEEQMGEMTQDMDAIADALNAITAKTEEIGPAMERASQPGSSAGARLAVMRRYAAAVGQPAADLKVCAARFTGKMVEMDEAVHAALDYVEATPAEDRDTETKSFLKDLSVTFESAREGVTGLTSFGALVEGLMELSRDMRGPAKDISSAMKQVGQAVARVERWEERARALM